MIYGRPCMIGQKAAVAVPLPLSCDDLNLDLTVCESARHPPQSSASEFYVLSLTLYEILHDVVYNYNLGTFHVTYSTEKDKDFGTQDLGQHSLFEIEVERNLS